MLQKLEDPAGKVCKPLYKKICSYATSLLGFTLLLAVCLGIFWTSGHYFKPIEGASMQPTINADIPGPEDIVLVKKDTYIHRGDIVIIDMRASKNYKVNQKLLIKRTIAFAGEKLTIRINEFNQAEVLVNDELLNEDYILTQNWSNINDFLDENDWFDWQPKGTIVRPDANSIIIPEGCMFCMGDNRAVSFDCRAIGPVPVKWCTGVVEYIIHPGTFWYNFIMTML